jgi:uncharacterized membrane protein
MQPDTPSIDIDARAESLTGYLRGAFVAGAVIVVPLLVTVFAVSFAVSTLSGLLTPAVVVLNRSVLAGDQFSTLTVQFVALVLVLLSFLVAGLLAKSDFGQRRVYPRIERWITSIPVLGPIYSSVNDLSEMFLDSDTESFEEVKLVEYPTEDSYSLAFVTADRRTVIDEAMGTNDTVTLFRPMAPNPMGGFLIHVPRDRVHDVDMSVDEGIQAVLSTGAALQSPDDGATPTEGT